MTKNNNYDWIIPLGIVSSVGYILYKYGSDLFSGLKDTSQGVGTAVSGVGSGISTIGQSLGTNTDKVLSLIGDTAEGTGNLFSDFFKSAYNLGQSLTNKSTQLPTDLTYTNVTKDTSSLSNSKTEQYYKNLYSQYPTLFQSEVDYLKSSGGYAPTSQVTDYLTNKISEIKNNSSNNKTTNSYISTTSTEDKIKSLISNSSSSSSSSSKSSSSSSSSWQSVSSVAYFDTKTGERIKAQ